ncbi:MAG: ribosome small subunit-dependent GTPase A [Clostridia bacterium]|nr:ribosome small subunit-dependent GTPase A [Clostridia bacterium]
MADAFIVKALSGFYYVLNDGNIYECRARGSFRKQGITPLVGDRVRFTTTDASHGVVDEILPRKNSLSRPAVANIDCLVIVSAYETPAPDALMIDRLTALARYRDIEPIVVFNKSDLGDFSAWQKIYRNAGIPTCTVSAQTGDGIADLKKLIAGKTCAFAGNSGVGKSSLLNTLFGEKRAQTGEVSERLGRGRHTTRHTELFATDFGGFIVDTPGFASVEISPDYDFKMHLAECFPDIDAFTDDCRFVSCTHTCEKGCGVLAALQDGKVESSRHASYCRLVEEMKDLKAWQTRK